MLQEKYRFTNDLGATLRQAVDHVCVYIPRPGPAADIGDTDIVDGDDRDLVRWKSLGGSDTPVIGAAFQALQVAGT